jgi:hypothetical protein
MEVMLTIVAIFGTLIAGAGALLMFVGWGIAFFGSAMHDRDAIPAGCFVSAIGFILFVVPLIIAKLCS